MKLGFLKGTVSGNRRDGTAFSESFNYEYSRDTVTMSVNNKLLIERGGIPSFNTAMGMTLIDQDGILKPLSDPFSVFFSFRKKLDAATLFTLTAQPYFSSTTAFTRILSSKENEIYDFNTNWPMESAYYNNSYWNGTKAGSSYVLYMYIGNDSYDVHYSQTTGSLLGVYTFKDNKFIESGSMFDLYNKLTLKLNPSLGTVVFHDATTGASLAEQIPDVPADQFFITNYTKDAATGVVTFDFEIKVSGHKSSAYRQNSTGHDLTITGKFNSGKRVYNTTGRTRG